jgi:hypothetical protein
MGLKNMFRNFDPSKFMGKPVVPLSIAALLITVARIVYSGWYSPLVLIPMRGDGITGIFGGVDGYFLPGPLRTLAFSILNHPYISLVFYYSIFHPLCTTGYLGPVIIVAAHLTAIAIILLSLRIFSVPGKKIIFTLLLTVVIFNWAPFYDGVGQGFPAEFVEVLGITAGFWLLLAGHVILAGAIFGFASTLKVLPVIFLPYFIYKKQYRLVISAVITCIILSAIIIWKENLHWGLVNSIFEAMGKNAAYGHDTRDAGLNAFIHFVFHRSLKPFLLINIHYASCIFLALFFILVERQIVSERNKYLFGFAAVSMAMFQVSPHTTEMYWHIFLLPALIFNIWLLVSHRDRLFTIIFTLSYIFLHGFSLLNILFRIISRIENRMLWTDLYTLFNVHGGVFIGIWLLYFSTYGLALKYLVTNEAGK